MLLYFESWWLLLLKVARFAWVINVEIELELVGIEPGISLAAEKDVRVEQKEIQLL